MCYTFHVLPRFQLTLTPPSLSSDYLSCQHRSEISGGTSWRHRFSPEQQEEERVLRYTVLKTTGLCRIIYGNQQAEEKN
ncbi:hypothetical protein NDU88_007724 [Pleurodeles waltl]|uniref:Uncharacterized protein n=1 Tax=Pleurodeles waltl TaxID=8319 RepID=A0AAV7N757_PLEWA|nr:hypothetical protein NDU88_007724 [Pleurodeles waltl]